MNLGFRQILTVVFVAGFAGAVRADVWSDCIGIYSAATAEADADGTLDPSSMTDIRHAADADAETHGWTFSTTAKGFDKTVKVRTEDVVCHPAETTLKGEKVVYFSQPSYVNSGGKTVVSNQLLQTSLYSMTNQDHNASYTALFRFRLDAEQVNSNLVYLLNMGYGWKKTGLSLRYVSTNSTLHFVYGNSSDNTISNLAVTNAANPSFMDVWTDLALKVSASDTKGTVRVGLGQKGAWRWGEASGTWLAGKKLVPNYPPRLGGYTTVNHASTDGNQRSCFRGSVHFLACWNRPLTDEEVMEAFASPRPKAMRLGGEGYGHEMFAGANGAIATNRMEGAVNLHGSFAAGETTSVDFTVDDRLDGTMQALRVRCTDDSGAGELTATVDGTDVGVLKFTANSEDVLFVPGKLLATNVLHRLTLTRTDAGADALKLELVEMAGSWMHGKANGAASEFAGDGGSIDYWLNQGYSNRAHSKISPDYSWQRLTLIDVIPEILTSRSRFRLEMRPSWMNMNDTQIQLKVNDGTEAKKVFVYPSKTDYPIQTVDFAPGELVAGTNYFRFTAMDHGAISIDYVKLMVRGPAPGAVLVVK